MKSSEALAYLKEKDRYLTTLGHISGILSWDMETVMPSKAEEERVEQMSLLALLMHSTKLDEKLKDAVCSIETDGLSDADKALVREYKRELGMASKVPSSLVKAMSEETAKAHSKWVEARSENKFSIFQPSLENLVSLSKEYASAIGNGDYNTLLDLYERGMTEEKIDSLFDELEVAIHVIMDKIEGRKVDTSFLNVKYDVKKEEEFCSQIAKKMGFDFSRGAIGIVQHPFTTTLGRDDIRISNRFTDESFVDPIFSIIHETGHALYEMNAALNNEIRGTSLSQGTSMGVHESQSRFWENLMGRSLPFWKYFYPSLQSYIPQLKDINLEQFVIASNYPHSSAIRVNADELTYSLHIILRYRIEKALFNGSLAVKDIPEAWNKGSESIIRYKVKTDSEGCLQDSHWSGGSFGYFPSYALGNLYSAAFLEKLYLDCGGKSRVDEALEKGEFGLITSWQDKNIWHYGAIYEPNTLMKRVTGKELSAKPFIKYLEDKFYSLYL